MRRTAPRPLAVALERVAGRLAPASVLAAVQAAWAEVVGPTIAQEAEPVSERGGVVTVACRSAVWAQELELMGADLTQRLNATLAGDSEPPERVAALRFTVARAGARGRR